MKRNIFALIALVISTTCAYCATAQPRLAAHGFTGPGLFHLTNAAPGEIEVSTNLHTWTKLNAVRQGKTLEDPASGNAGWRFYRAVGGGAASTNLVGYVKVTIPPGKMAVLGNPFMTVLRVDTPEGRHEVFGSTNPPVKLLTYENGTFMPHTFDKANGSWMPALAPIRGTEGFAIENVGSSPIQVKMSGELRLRNKMSLPAGSSLVVPPVPEVGPTSAVLGIPGNDGTQIDYFDEDTQKHIVSTYDSLAKGWEPQLPAYKPGRALVVKAPAATTWTKPFPATAR
jgi:hypothetical protein